MNGTTWIFLVVGSAPQNLGRLKKGCAKWGLYQSLNCSFDFFYTFYLPKKKLDTFRSPFPTVLHHHEKCEKCSQLHTCSLWRARFGQVEPKKCTPAATISALQPARKPLRKCVGGAHSSNSRGRLSDSIVLCSHAKCSLVGEADWNALWGPCCWRFRFWLKITQNLYPRKAVIYNYGEGAKKERIVKIWWRCT